MKILIIHYKYSITGGPERYMFNITNLLEKDGHEVIHFSINWNDNIETKQKSFWPKIKHTQGEFHLNRIQFFEFSSSENSPIFFWNGKHFHSVEMP